VSGCVVSSTASTSSSLEVSRKLCEDGLVTLELLTVGELAERAGLETSAVRYYDDIGLITSTRTSGGQRRFGRDVLRRLALIRVAQRVGLSLEDIRAALDSLPDARTPTPADWKRLSTQWKTRLNEQIALLEAVRDELSSCIGCGCLSFNVCALYNPLDEARVLGAGAHFLYGRRLPIPTRSKGRTGDAPVTSQRPPE
jgi:MerR family transcriptional regulator, redox-sensitive transcriptional activator SoxR